ncbi:MAG TPA: LacI family DNA-binding transcriptional regulator [Ktedonobacteraceae bacterium]|nr:LacI family DNA-binding transcriptional regulator [Ktedonobacteraceae bacterium]
MATLQDIALAVGVTPTTVANALKGRGNVSEATRKRILQCAEELKYRPNMLARSLAQGKTYTLGFLLPTIANPFYPEIAEAIERTANQHGYQMLLCNTLYDSALGQQHLDRLVSRWVDGIIIMGSSMDIDAISAQFQRGLPIVLCDWQEDEAVREIPQVSVDFRTAGRLAAQHLLDLGHRQLAIIVDEPQQTLRLEGFRTSLQSAGISLDKEMIQQGHSTLESGYAAAQQLLALSSRPTAIFATTDWMALGAVEAALDAGLRVPQDLSVIGLDDIVVSAHIRPPLTTVAVPKFQLAKEATELLLSLIDEKPDLQLSRLVEPTLVVRQSTASLTTT